MKKYLLIGVAMFFLWAIYKDFCFYVLDIELTQNELGLAEGVGSVIGVWLWWICIPRFIFRVLKRLFTASVDATPQPDQPLKETEMPLSERFLYFLSPHYRQPVEVDSVLTEK